MTMTEEKLEREENERDALDAVGGHECPSGISVEVVVSAVVAAVAVVDIKTLTIQSIAQVRDRLVRGQNVKRRNAVDERCWSP